MKIEMGMTVLMAIMAVSALLPLASSLAFNVGDNNGWVSPGKNHSQFYNNWANRKRFITGDTLVFRYKSDSVLEVDETDYKKCTSSKPIFFSNDGDSTVELDKPGPHYFSSGVREHCIAGERMVVNVLDVEPVPGFGAVDPSQAPSDSPKNSGAAPAAGTAAALLVSAVAVCGYLLF